MVGAKAGSSGGVLRYVSPVSAALGIATQFIWVDSATVAHPIIGTAFFAWLVAIGMMLLTGRTEEPFTRFVDNRQGPDIRSARLLDLGGRGRCVGEGQFNDHGG